MFYIHFYYIAYIKNEYFSLHRNCHQTHFFMTHDKKIVNNFKIYCQLEILPPSCIPTTFRINSPTDFHSYEKGYPYDNLQHFFVKLSNSKTRTAQYVPKTKSSLNLFVYTSFLEDASKKMVTISEIRWFHNRLRNSHRFSRNISRSLFLVFVSLICIIPDNEVRYWLQQTSPVNT